MVINEQWELADSKLLTEVFHCMAKHCPPIHLQPTTQTLVTVFEQVSTAKLAELTWHTTWQTIKKSF